MRNSTSIFKRGGITGRKAMLLSLIGGSTLFVSEKAAAQSAGLTTMGAAYTQNFDSLSNGASTTYPLTLFGWYLNETGGGARDNEFYAADNGNSTTGDTYSYGTSAATDRSLGSLRSGTLVATYGASFTNRTGAAIGSLDVHYTGEEWRCGATGRTDDISFQYSLNATSLTTGTWVSVTALNFVTPVTTSTGAKDGNAAANRTAISSTISGLNIPNGAVVWIRWNDDDATGADDGLAVDDFSITPNAVPPAPEIDVTGNSVSIVSGDVTPSAADFTDFGTQSVCSGTVTHIFTIYNTGTANLTFSGSPSIAISGTNASDFTTPGLPVTTLAAGASTSFAITFDPSGSGTRTATISIANNDSDENPYTFAISGTGSNVSIVVNSTTNVSCNGGTNGAATITASGGVPSYTYSWSPSGGSAATATNLGAGTYVVTVSDVNSCSTTQSVTITEPTALVAASTAGSILCNGGVATVMVSATGGTMPYTGTDTVTVNAGTYNYAVTDAHGCTSTTTVNVTEPDALVASSTATDILCNGGTSDVTIGATGGTMPYFGTQTITVNAGTYNYTVTDNNGCTSSTTVTVTEPDALAATSTATAILCNGGASTITVSATGGTMPYTGTGLFTAAAGSYSLTVTDDNGCTSTTSGMITEPDALMATSSATNILCNGGTASVTIGATGGTTPYAGTGMLTVNAGTYNYTVTDSNGCVANTSITVTEPVALSAMATATSIACNGGTSTVTVSGSGGTMPYTGTGTFTEINGTYNYTVTDDNGCTSATSVTITEPAPINVSTSTSGTTITANNSAADSYQWFSCDMNTELTGETNQSLNTTMNGAYAVIITEGGCVDTSSCVAIFTTGITANSSLSADAMNIYPNPATAQITVQLANNAFTKGSVISVYDAVGKRVSATAVTSETTTIDLQQLQKGIYFISLQNANGVVMKKIIKE